MTRRLSTERMLRREKQPTPEDNALIEGIEESGNHRWIGPLFDEDGEYVLDEHGDFIRGECEDRSGCDAASMDLETWASLLRDTLPGPVHGFHVGGLPPEPTDATPGSDEKILILQQRARRGLSLHHPDDRKSVRHPRKNEDDE